ncbi:putative hydro-lyase [Alcaligenes faecalis]|uniref:putative hydro-lyase n=1 Tax=Alcaligenes faecalis TaxID=511 RepID=UPI0010CA4B0D|nr:putative hydro-lyase [Alcaligenes faecalis]QCP82474.1 putative hydro-lyase [Alcaligenes faecalis]
MNLQTLPVLAPEAEKCRELIRQETHTGPTAGLAAGYVQANLMILPKDWADEFLLFCQRNPKPCPLLAVTEPGQFQVPTLGGSIDLRTDFPRYRVWQNGELSAEPLNIEDVWRDDLVSFLIGCSFSFEEALLADGIDVRHISAGVNVPMYRSSIQTQGTQRLSGPLVVSMRPMRAADAIRAIQITSRFPSVHGAPVHIGDPSLIGINDLQQPDYGDAVPVGPDELPVFWACGVTPQAVAAQAKPQFCITHAPGHMLITDLPNTRLAAL